MENKEIYLLAIELLRKTEQAIVERSLRPYLSGELSDHIQDSLSLILTSQFRDEQFTEVGGYIHSSEEGLEFKIVENQLEVYLKRYEAGDASEEVINTLYQCANEFREANERNGYDQKSYEMQIVRTLCDVFKAYSDPSKAKNLNLERKKIAAWYREKILHNFYLFDSKESNYDYIGKFHVHGNASEPSSIDIETNKLKATPDLVISATPDYQQSGVKLYLVHSGSFELLYNGLLKSKE